MRIHRLALTVGMLMLAGVAAAQPVPERPPGGPPTSQPTRLIGVFDRFSGALAKVEMTDEQRQQINAVISDAAAAAQKMQIAGQRDQMRDLVQQTHRRTFEMLDPQQKQAMRDAMAAPPQRDEMRDMRRDMRGMQSEMRDMRRDLRGRQQNFPPPPDQRRGGPNSGRQFFQAQPGQPPQGGPPGGEGEFRPQHGPQGPGGPPQGQVLGGFQQGQPPQQGPQMIDRYQQSVSQLDLTPEQKAKIDAAFADAKAKLEAARQATQDLRTDVQGVLTPEQQAKLRELMMNQGPMMGQPDGGPGFGREGRPDRPPREMRPPRGEGGAGGPFPPGGPQGGTPQELEMNSPMYPEQLGTPPPAPPPPQSEVDIGDTAPNFNLRKLDGGYVQLSSYSGNVLVLMFGSYTCPTFRDQADDFEQLKREMGSRATFLIVYTKEAHPAGEWDVQRNKDDSIQIRQPADFDARLEVAKQAKENLKISLPIAVDDIDNTIANSYGLFPNGAVVISRDGKIAARQSWADPRGIRRHLEAALKPATQPSQP